MTRNTPACRLHCRVKIGLPIKSGAKFVLFPITCALEAFYRK